MEKTHPGIAGFAYVATKRLPAMAVVEYPVLGMDTTYGAVARRWHWIFGFEGGADLALLSVASLTAIASSAMATISFHKL